MLFLAKTVIAAMVIAVTSWLANKRPDLAGFIIALPIASLLALVFAQMQHHDDAASIAFAKSILIGVPVSWLFFLPFFGAEKWGYGFWTSFAAGIALLVVGFFIHRYVMGIIT